MSLFPTCGLDWGLGTSGLASCVLPRGCPVLQAGSPPSSIPPGPPGVAVGVQGWRGLEASQLRPPLVGPEPVCPPGSLTPLDPDAGDRGPQFSTWGFQDTLQFPCRVGGWLLQGTKARGGGEGKWGAGLGRRALRPQLRGLPPPSRSRVSCPEQHEGPECGGRGGASLLWLQSQACSPSWGDEVGEASRVGKCQETPGAQAQPASGKVAGTWG